MARVQFEMKRIEKGVAKSYRAMVEAAMHTNWVLAAVDMRLAPLAWVALPYKRLLVNTFARIPAAQYQKGIWGKVAKIVSAFGSAHIMRLVGVNSGLFIPIKANGHPDFTPWLINMNGNPALAEPKDLFRAPQLFFPLTGKYSGNRSRLTHGP